MNFSPSVPVPGKSELLPAFIAAFLIVMILFFVDEGYYDFRWMADWGNWFVFGIYMLIFFPLQWFMSYLLFRKMTGWKKVAVMVLISVPVTIGFLWIVL